MSAPHFTIYSNLWRKTPPPASDIKGYNVYILSFLLLEKVWDTALEWQNLSDTERENIKKDYTDAGIKLMVSAFGSTNTPTTSGADPIATADRFAEWVKKYKLDGIDVNYEDLEAFNTGRAEEWLVKFTKQLRVNLPSPYIVTHAPLGPWFSPTGWPGGGYLKVHKEVGNLINWYNIQYYNQGESYTTIEDLVEKCSRWSQTAVLEIMGNKVPASMIVIGKPADKGSAPSGGYMPTSTLASALERAKKGGWDGGVMVWQYPKADSNWIKEVRALSWPVNAKRLFKSLL